jgi:hypothetical protein
MTRQPLLAKADIARHEQGPPTQGLGHYRDCGSSNAIFDTIIVLTSAAERSMLTSLLSARNPCSNIVAVETLVDLYALEPTTLARARLISYVDGVTVPADVLGQLGHGAYNFHPGPTA